MTRDDAEKFGKLIEATAEILDAPVSELRQLGYFAALADLDYDAIASAVQSHIRTSKFFPKPAEIRELVLGGFESLIEAQWIAMRDAMRVVGAYRSLICWNPALAYTVLAVFSSWPGACTADFTPEMWAAKRKEFDRAYRVFAGRELPPDPVILPGSCQIHNDQNPAWTRFTGYGVLEGSRARVLSLDEAQAFLTSRRLTAPAKALPEPERELSPDEARTALESAVSRIAKEKGL